MGLQAAAAEEAFEWLAEQQVEAANRWDDLEGLGLTLLERALVDYVRGRRRASFDELRLAVWKKPGAKGCSDDANIKAIGWTNVKLQETRISLHYLRRVWRYWTSSPHGKRHSVL